MTSETDRKGDCGGWSHQSLCVCIGGEGGPQTKGEAGPKRHGAMSTGTTKIIDMSHIYI